MTGPAAPTSPGQSAPKTGRPEKASSPAQPEERIRGTVLRITFRNDENDYRVVKLHADGPIDPSKVDLRGEVVLVGHLPGIEVGLSIEAGGSWMTHSKHGPQFQAKWFKPSLPTGAKGIETFLSSGVLKGVGPVLAARIVQEFGQDTFRVLDEEIDSVRRVKGITGRRFADIKRSWSEAQTDRELITFLGEYGISPAWAHRLRKTYGEAALSVVRSNPYRLAQEVRGIGFSRADAMARQIGLALDSPERIEAALSHILERRAGEGHTFARRPALLAMATDLLELDETLVEPQLDAMLEADRLTPCELRGEPLIFLNALYEAELGCAKRLDALVRAKRRVPQIDIDAFLEKFSKNARVQLSNDQRTAVERIANEGLMVLTGGPGTGKTTTLRAVIELYLAAGRTVRLAAPTGRAARRLSESAGAPADTIHRLLGFQPHNGKFQFNETNPVSADLIVIDEASMLDVTLAHDLLKALQRGACLLLVGDQDQLPSVGPGNVLRDIIASGRIPVSALQEVFRQAESSMIVTNAHRVNQGMAPLLDSETEGREADFFFIDREDPEELVETLKVLVTERIPNKFGVDPKSDIQILTPMRRGPLGVIALNQVLQEALNPPRNSARAGGDGESNQDAAPTRFDLRVGDRVMQTSNDYTRGVSNGDIGLVQSFNREEEELLVRFSDRTVAYLSDEIRQLTLAYAVTIHKSQGSEYPVVVIPLHMQHYVMLQRNLLYTAITRARRLVCVIGTKKALMRAVRNAKPVDRDSALAVFLRLEKAG